MSSLIKVSLFVLGMILLTPLIFGLMDCYRWWWVGTTFLEWDDGKGVLAVLLACGAAVCFQLLNEYDYRR